MTRAIHELLYKGLCTIKRKEKFYNPVTCETEYKLNVVCENQKCKLSFGSSPSGEQTDTVTTASQTVKLFISPEITIQSGDEITILQNNVTYKYWAIGFRAVYPNHQEISLKEEA